MHKYVLVLFLCISVSVCYCFICISHGLFHICIGICTSSFNESDTRRQAHSYHTTTCNFSIHPYWRDRFISLSHTLFRFRYILNIGSRSRFSYPNIFTHDTHAVISQTWVHILVGGNVVNSGISDYLNRHVIQCVNVVLVMSE